jgi:hypothetical protein
LGDGQEDQEPQNTMPTGGQMTKMVPKRDDPLDSPVFWSTHLARLKLACGCSQSEC